VKHLLAGPGDMTVSFSVKRDLVPPPAPLPPIPDVTYSTRISQNDDLEKSLKVAKITSMALTSMANKLGSLHVL